MTYRGLSGRELFNAWQEAKGRGLTQNEHAKEIGMPLKIYTDRLHIYSKRLKTAPDKELFNQISFGSPWHLQGDFVIVGDLHIPCTDYEWAQLPVQVAMKHLKKPRRLIIAGDLFNFDALSSFPFIVSPPTWAQEKAMAAHLLDFYLEYLDEIWMIVGNHERRLQRFTMAQLDDSDILGMVRSKMKKHSEKVTMSNYSYCTVTSGGIDWRITHPKNYSQIQLRVANDLAQKFDTNVIEFHEHILGMSWDKYYRYVIVNGGSLVDPNKLSYVAMDDNKSPVMMKGFVLLKNGAATPLGEAPFTDWAEWV